jgi:hypothetical protein
MPPGIPMPDAAAGAGGGSLLTANSSINKAATCGSPGLACTF